MKFLNALDKGSQNPSKSAAIKMEHLHAAGTNEPSLTAVERHEKSKYCDVQIYKQCVKGTQQSPILTK